MAGSKNANKKTVAPAKAKNVTTKIKKVAPEKVMKDVKSVLFVTGEAVPFIRTGGLGDVAGALPKTLIKAGVDARVILPFYSKIPSTKKSTMKFLGETYVQLGWRNEYVGVYGVVSEGVTYYFIDNKHFFGRDLIYGANDDGERYAFFCKAVLEALLIIGFAPEVIHCNDWHTALVPVLLDLFFRGADKLKDVKTLFTIHNIEYQGNFDLSLARDFLSIPEDKLSLVEYDGRLNFMKGGIECANAVNTVSPTYAGELMYPFYAYGLDGILSLRRNKLSGILNGLDTELYNPMTDPSLFVNYDINSMDKKLENKREMLEMLNMNFNPERPLIAVVSRLATQKGLDLLTAVAEELLSGNIQLVVLGTGEWRFESALKDLERRYEAKLKVIINFSKDLASKLYAASDIFLMPSKFEPCGLSQLIAMRYGSIPVVRETGGLKDTVKPFNPETGEGVGYTFVQYNAHDMLSAIWRAVDTFYNNKSDWAKVMHNAMSLDFGWDKPAEEYRQLYNRILNS